MTYNDLGLKQLLELGHGQYHKHPVPLYSNRLVPHARIPVPDPAPDVNTLYEIPIAFSFEESRSLEDQPYGLQAGAQRLFRALFQPGQTFSFELQISPGKARFVIVGQHHTQIQRAIEGHFPKSETLPPVSVLDGLLAQSMQGICSSKLTQEYSISVQDGFPQAPPHSPYMAPVSCSKSEHTAEMLFELATFLENEFEVVNVRCIFAPAPFKLSELLRRSQEAMAYASFFVPNVTRNNVQSDKFDKGANKRPAYAFRIQAIAITKKERQQRVESVLRTFLSTHRFGEKPFKIKTWHDYLNSGITAQQVRNSLILRQSFTEGSLCSDYELSDLFSYPNSTLLDGLDVEIPIVRADRIPRSYPSSNRKVVGKNPNDDRPVKVPSNELGIFLIGASGTGKSSCTYSLIAQYAEDKAGQLIIPWGEDLNFIVGAIPPSQRHRTLIIQASPDNPHPPGFDIFNSASAITRDLVSILMMLFEQGNNLSSFGEQMVELATLGIDSFSRIPNSTIAHLYMGLCDTQYFKDAISDINDPILQATKDNHLSRRSSGRDSFASVANRVRYFVEKGIRNLFCQLHPTVDIKQLLNKIIIVDLNGISTLSAAALAGTLLLLFYAALKDRYFEVMQQGHGAIDPFIFFCDEAGKYVPPGVSTMLDTGRKYGLQMFPSCQHLHNFSPDIKSSLMSALSKMIFRVSAEDAWLLQNDIGVPAKELAFLEQYHCYFRRDRNAYHLKGLHNSSHKRVSDREVKTILQQTTDAIGGKPVEFSDEYFNTIFPNGRPKKTKKPNRKTNGKSTTDRIRDQLEDSWRDQ